jgi:tetratricopeptide (TPR) repeat protein
MIALLHFAPTELEHSAYLSSYKHHAPTELKHILRTKPIFIISKLRQQCMSRLNLTRRRLWVLLTLTLICLSSLIVAQRFGVSVFAEDERKVASPGKRVRDEREAAIEAASFARVEFFGTEALVAYPTVEARNRLAEVLGKYPDAPQIYLRLSELDERLSRFDEAEQELQTFVELQQGELGALITLASFQDRRAQFEKEAATFERMLVAASPERRAQIFERLIELARAHGLENYLKPDFYQKYIAEGVAVFGIIEQLLDKQIEEGNYTEALNVLRQYKDRYPERQSYLLEKEV